jgi:hypothetical protein
MDKYPEVAMVKDGRESVAGEMSVGGVVVDSVPQ